MRCTYKVTHALHDFGFKILCGAVLFSLSASPLYAASVNCNANGQELQKQIDVANTGDVISIEGVCDGGTYTVRNKHISMRGQGGGATLSAPDGGIVLVVVNASVSLDNLDIVGGDEDGIFAVTGSNLSLSHVAIHDAAGAAIHVSESSFANFDSSEFYDNGLGLLFTENSSFLMADTSITNNGGFGIFMLGGGSGSLYPNNLIDGHNVGIAVNLPSSLRMSGATLTNNTTGVKVSRFGFVQLDTSNTFANNAVDLRCEESAGIAANELQASNDGQPGNVDSDGSCTIIGPIF